MPSPERIYHGSVRVFSVILLILGIVILGSTLTAGGGPTSLGVALGVAFVAVGAGRLWLTGRMSTEDDRR